MWILVRIRFTGKNGCTFLGKPVAFRGKKSGNREKSRFVDGFGENRV